MINTISFSKINNRNLKVINQVLMILLFVFLSINIHAGGLYTEEGLITQMRVGTYGDLLVYHTSASHPNPGNCSSSADYYRVPISLSHYNTLYTMLLTAFTTQQPIYMYVNGCELNNSRVIATKIIK